MIMSEEVKVARTAATTTRVYHTRECRTVTNNDNLKEIRKEIATDRYDECKYCSGEYDNTGGTYETYYHTLREMDTNAD